MSVPDPQLVNKYRYHLFAAAALGTFMATFEGSILNVALPTIARAFELPVESVAWVALAYTLTMVSLLMAFGAWTESKGYSFAYKFGYTAFILGSIICALSPTVEVLIAGRVVQATGTAMFAAVGPGLVTTVFPPNERGKGLGLIVMMVAAGFMVGPTVGGLMLDIWPWQSIFVAAIPIGLVGLFLAFRYFRILPPPEKSRPVPIRSSIAIGATMLSGMLALRMISEYAVSDIRVWGLALVSLVAGITFLILETKPHTALIGLTIFRNKPFTTAILASLCQFIATAGVLILVPFFLEDVKGLEPKEVGLYLIILPVLMFILAPTAGKLSDKIGYRALTSFGMTMIAVGMFMLSLVEVDSSNWYVVGSLCVAGIGVGVFSTPNSSAMMGAVTDKQRAITSGILATTRNTGMSIGIALATSLFAFFEVRFSDLGPAAAFVAAYKRVIWVAMGIAIIGIPLCLTRANRVDPTPDSRSP